MILCGGLSWARRWVGAYESVCGVLRSVDVCRTCCPVPAVGCPRGRWHHAVHHRYWHAPAHTRHREHVGLIWWPGRAFHADAQPCHLITQVDCVGSATMYSSTDQRTWAPAGTWFSQVVARQRAWAGCMTVHGLCAKYMLQLQHVAALPWLASCALQAHFLAICLPASLQLAYNFTAANACLHDETHAPPPGTKDLGGDCDQFGHCNMWVASMHNCSNASCSMAGCNSVHDAVHLNITVHGPSAAPMCMPKHVTDSRRSWLATSEFFFLSPHRYECPEAFTMADGIIPFKYSEEVSCLEEALVHKAHKCTWM